MRTLHDRGEGLLARISIGIMPLLWLVATALGVALIVPGSAAHWVVAALGALGALVLAAQQRDDAAWLTVGWRQLELLSPELVGQLDERALLRVALADSSALLRCEVTQLVLHARPGREGLVAVQRDDDREEGVEIRVLGPDEPPADLAGGQAVSLGRPGHEIGRLSVAGGSRRRRRIRRQLLTGLAHLVAGSVSAERMYEEQRGLADELYRTAMRDDLTELGNRALLHERGSQHLARSMAQQKRSAVLLLDLDDFKRVNDTLGHDVGDALLIEVGRRIRAQVRDTDLAVRLGGDEFVVLASELAHFDDAQLLADRLLGAIAAPVRVDGMELSVTASLGIALHGLDADSVDGLVAQADRAMYQAKADGRGRWRRRTPGPRSRAQAHTGSDHGLLGAGRTLPEGVLVLHYQPQVDAESGQVLGFEVLTRWSHPDLGLLAPEEFLPQLESSGLMSRLTASVLDQALADLPRLREAAPGASLSVNVSPRNLLECGLVEEVGNVLARHSVTGADVVLEMTEPAPEPSPAVDAVLSGLAALGCSVSIQEFGTGQSSLTALSHPVIAEVKLAPRLVSTVQTEPRAERLVRATVDSAHGLGLRVVAEGVHSAEVAAALAALGCDRLQGFGIAAPAPVGELVEVAVPSPRR